MFWYFLKFLKLDKIFSLNYCSVHKSGGNENIQIKKVEVTFCFPKAKTQNTHLTQITGFFFLFYINTKHSPQTNNRFFLFNNKLFKYTIFL